MAWYNKYSKEVESVQNNRRERRNLRNRLKQIQMVKTWQLVLIFLLMSFVSASLLRLNNVGMIERRDAVMTADQSCDKEVIKNRLYDLQRYVSGHMNTDLGSRGVALENLYNCDYQNIMKEQQQYHNENGNIFKKVQDICAPKYSSNSQGYKDCVNTELANFPQGQELVDIVNLPTEPYYHSFASPRWSPDFAGFAVLITALVGVIIILRWVSVLVIRLILKFKYKSI